jgi:hypothetical protein
MKPFGRDKWVLGSHQHDPEVAKLNRRLLLLSNITQAHSAILFALFLVVLLAYPPNDELLWLTPLLVLGFGLNQARYMRRRSFDLDSIQDNVQVGTNLSRAERTDADYSSLITGIIINVVPYVVLYWWVSEGHLQ